MILIEKNGFRKLVIRCNLMQQMRDSLSIFLVLILLSFVLQNMTANISASPSFPRQEIGDNPQDWLDEKSIPIKKGDAFTDMIDISYLNDGKHLNATIWLAGSFLEEPPREVVSYGVLIDVDSNDKTGLHGFDYMSEILWDGNTWTRTFEERTRFNDIRFLKIEKNYTGFFDKEQNNVRLFLDLDAMEND